MYSWQSFCKRAKICRVNFLSCTVQLIAAQLCAATTILYVRLQLVAATTVCGYNYCTVCAATTGCGYNHVRLHGYTGAAKAGVATTG